MLKIRQEGSGCLIKFLFIEASFNTLLAEDGPITKYCSCIFRTLQTSQKNGGCLQRTKDVQFFIYPMFNRFMQVKRESL
jgi:hypothetical protein